MLCRTASAPKGHLLGHALYLVFKDRYSLCRRRRKSFDNRIVNEESAYVSRLVPLLTHALLPAGKFYGQAMGPISTGQLHVLLRFHTQPIDVVVYHGSHWQVSSRVWLHA